jgi:glycosyltransferase involved in cell wall biosynthesis
MTLKTMFRRYDLFHSDLWSGRNRDVPRPKENTRFGRRLIAVEQAKRDFHGSLSPAQNDRHERKRHILVLQKASSFGGSVTCVLDWLRGIDYGRCKVSVTYTADVLSARINDLGLPVLCVPLKLQVSGNFWNVFYSWLSYLRKMRPDQIIMVEGFFLEWPLPVVLAAYFVSRGNIFMTEHAPFPEPQSRSSRIHFGFLPGLGLRRHLSMWKLRARAPLCRCVLAVGEELKQWVIRNYRYPPEKILVAYHGVEVSRFCRVSGETRKALRSSFGVPENGVLIVSTARLSPEKRLDRLIRTLSLLIRKHPNLWLIFAGDGPQEAELRCSAKSSLASARISFLGWLEDVSPLLQAGDIFVLPSDFEGFGLALLEAMSTQLLCVATNTQGPSEVIVDGKNGFLVEASDSGVIEGLSKALGLSPCEREAIERSARQTVLERFPFEEGIRRGLAALNIPVANGHTDL